MSLSLRDCSSNEESNEESFGPWRRLFWPVRSSELPKILPMIAIFFLLSFNYDLLRTMKDGLLIPGREHGAEVLPFIKVWVLLPSAVLLLAFYTYLSRYLYQTTIFYIVISAFLLYFLLFALFLYPNGEILHLHGFADALEKELPRGLRGCVAMIRYWSFTTFYIMAELWGTIALFTLFWAFVNRVMGLGEAHRFYGLFGIGANVSAIVAGGTSMGLIQFRDHLPLFLQKGGEDWFYYQIALILLAGSIALFLFWRLQLEPTISQSDRLFEEKSDRHTVSLMGNLETLLNHRYLFCLALIVFCYNVVINLVEVVWKDQVALLYPEKHDFVFFMNQVTMVTGIIATLMALFASTNFLRWFGWRSTALITPIMLLVTSGFFFGAMLSPSSFESLYLPLGLSSLSVVVFFGTLQNILSRGAKYTLFNATKELAFVPLPAHLQLRGKGVIDGLASRSGKSLGSLLHQLLLVFGSTIAVSVPFVAMILLVVMLLWTCATIKLAPLFERVSRVHLLNNGRFPLPMASNDLAKGHLM